MAKLKTVATALAIAGAVALGAPGAKAGLIVDYSYNGSAFANADPSSTNPFSSAAESIGTLSVTFLQVKTDSPGTPSAGNIDGGTLNITNTGLVADTLKVLIAGTGFTEPTVSGTLTGSVAITDAGAGATLGSTVTEYACAFSGTVTTAGQCNTGAAQTATVSLTDSTSSDSFSASSSIVNPPITAPFTLGDYLTLTIAPGASFSVTTSADETAIPEPMSIALLGAGLGGLGLIRRRRKSV